MENKIDILVANVAFVYNDDYGRIIISVPDKEAECFQCLVHKGEIQRTKELFEKWSKHGN